MEVALGSRVGDRLPKLESDVAHDVQHQTELEELRWKILMWEFDVVGDNGIADRIRDFWSEPMTRDLRGRPEHLVRFSDETAPDTRTTDGRKVPVYATVNEGAPIDWYDDLLTHIPNAPEVKSRWVLAHFERLPLKTRGRIRDGLREVTIHISDPRPYLGRADEACRRTCSVDFETFLRLTRQSKHKEVVQIGERLSSLIGQQMLRDSFGHRLSRVLLIAEQRAWLSPWPAEEDLGHVIHQLRRPSKSIFASVSEYTARGSAAFAPAFEKATTGGGEADLRRFWFGPDSNDLIFRGTLKPLEDGHAFDAGNERLTRILDSMRRSMVKRLIRNTGFAIRRPQAGVPAFVDMDSRADKRIQAADIAAGLARHVLGQEGPVGLIRRWAKVYYNGSRLTENNLEPVLRFWSRLSNQSRG